MDRIHRMLTGMGGAGQGGPPGDTPQVDTAEQIYISSLALLKMLKHGEQQLRLHKAWVRAVFISNGLCFCSSIVLANPLCSKPHHLPARMREVHALSNQMHRATAPPAAAASGAYYWP
jgi:hypothetical protein